MLAKIFPWLAAATFSMAGTFQQDAINVKTMDSLMVKPDICYFDLTVAALHPSADSALLKVRPAIAAVESVFTRHGITNAQAVVKEMSISAQYERSPEGERRLQGYQARRSYTITYRDMDKLSGLLVDLRLAGASEFGQLVFNHTRLDSLQRVVAKRAVAKAQRMGKELASGAGVRIGPASVISNEPPSDYSFENRVDIDFEFGKGEDSHSLMLGSLLGGGGAAPTAQLAQQEALRQFFRIAIEEISVKNIVWVTYPILR